MHLPQPSLSCLVLVVASDNYALTTKANAVLSQFYFRIHNTLNKQTESRNKQNNVGQHSHAQHKAGIYIVRIKNDEL